MRWSDYRRKFESFQDRVYLDEVIEFKRPESKEETYIPEEIKAMRSLVHFKAAYTQPSGLLFVRQAKLMESFEDDFEFNKEVIRYYPTYQSFSDEELRGYFSWRTRWRRGIFERTSLSFAYLYIYEMLNGIGSNDALEGYRNLKYFGEIYGELDDRILPLLNNWIWDYVIYHGLSSEYLIDHDEYRADERILSLFKLSEKTDEEITRAVIFFSGYRLEKSRLYKERTEDVTAVVAGVFRKIEEHYSKGCKKTWIEDYIGSISIEPVIMFRSAVFSYPRKMQEKTYRVNEIRSYYENNGIWTCRHLVYNKKKKHKISAVLRTVDSMIRTSCDYGHPIKPDLVPKWMEKIIYQAIEEQKEAVIEARKHILKLDLSTLGNIRSNAEYTMERLIVPEEIEEYEDDEETTAGDIPSKEELLSRDEYRYLQCLLYGKDTSWVRTQCLMSSILTDSINEKLFDTFFDTVIENDEIVEDYFDDLKEIIPDENT